MPITMTRQERAKIREKTLKYLEKQGIGDAYIPLDEDSNQNLETISSGSLILDRVFGVGGWPRGRICEVFGPEAVGKCVTSDTLISTVNGLLTVDEIFESQNIPTNQSNISYDIEYPLINRYGVVENTKRFTCNGVRKTFTIKTKSGNTVTATSNHPHLTMNTRGNWIWKYTGNITNQDYLMLPRELPFGNTKVDLDTAYMYGLLIADVDYRFCRKEKCIEFFEKSCIDSVLSNKKTLGKHIRSLDKDSLREVLKGYFDCGDYIDISRYYIEVVSASEKLLQEIKTILMQFGILSLIREHEVKEYPDNEYWRLIITGESAKQFVEEIGSRSQKRLDSFRKMMLNPHPKGSTNIDSIPYCNMILRDLYDSCETTRKENRVFCDYMGEKSRAKLTYPRLAKIIDCLESDSHLMARLKEIQNTHYFYDQVVSVTENSEPEPTYDFEMSDTHSFIANGIITHNTSLAIAACVEAQRDGGFATYIDFEHAIHLGYAKAMGLDLSPDAFAFFQPNYFEGGAQVAYLYAKVMKSDIIVIDSVSAMIPKKIFEAGPQDPSKGMGLQARLMSNFLNQISKVVTESNTVLLFINQMRANIKISQYDTGPDWATSGGQSLPYYATIRVRLKPGIVEKANVFNELTGEKELIPISSFVKAETYKNKVALPKRKGEFVVRYGEGIDNVRSIIAVAIQHKIIRKDGAWYAFMKEGEQGYVRKQGIEQLRKFFLDYPNIFKLLMDAVGDKLASFEVNKIDQEISDEDLIVQEKAPAEEDAEESGESQENLEDLNNFLDSDETSKPIDTDENLLSLEDIDDVLERKK